MSFDRKAILALPTLLALGACTHGLASDGEPLSEFGEANRQTMMAQVIDPDPQYETLVPETNGQRAANAVERHKADKVKRPKSVPTTQDD